MPEFETPTCDRGHAPTEMEFLESYDPLTAPSCGPGVDCTEWRERWRYSCSECGRVVEVLEAVGRGYEQVTVRESGEETSRDSTSLSPLKD